MVVLLLGALPKHVVFLPPWVSYASAIAVFMAFAAAALLDDPRWRRAEHGLVMLLGVVYAANTVAQLADLVGIIAIRPQETTAAMLLSSAVGIWIETVVVFSLVYWQVDAGGPEERARGTATMPDWGFPTAPTAAGTPATMPGYVDYFCLAYTTATAFSPTDVSPYTHRAKLLMTLESALSLVTLVVVVSHAINVLPG